MTICKHAYYVEACFKGRNFRASRYYHGCDDAREHAEKRLEQLSLGFPKDVFSLREKTFSSEEELYCC